jgi:hypothetical protein
MKQRNRSLFSFKNKTRNPWAGTNFEVSPERAQSKAGMFMWPAEGRFQTGYRRSNGSLL